MLVNTTRLFVLKQN